MNNFTTNTFQMKRELINFSKHESKFLMDMIYGISKSKDILLSSISEALDEKTKKAYVIDRLSDNISCDLDYNSDKKYYNTVIDSFGENPVFIIDDSDVVKHLGSKFENLVIIRDGSSKNKIIDKRYLITYIFYQLFHFN